MSTDHSNHSRPEIAAAAAQVDGEVRSTRTNTNNTNAMMTDTTTVYETATATATTAIATATAGKAAADSTHHHDDHSNHTNDNDWTLLSPMGEVQTRTRSARKKRRMMMEHQELDHDESLAWAATSTLMGQGNDNEEEEVENEEKGMPLPSRRSNKRPRTTLGGQRIGVGDLDSTTMHTDNTEETVEMQMQMQMDIEDDEDSKLPAAATASSATIASNDDVNATDSIIIMATAASSESTTRATISTTATDTADTTMAVPKTSSSVSSTLRGGGPVTIMPPPPMPLPLPPQPSASAAVVALRIPSHQTPGKSSSNSNRISMPPPPPPHTMTTSIHNNNRNKLRLNLSSTFTTTTTASPSIIRDLPHRPVEVVIVQPPRVASSSATAAGAGAAAAAAATAVLRDNYSSLFRCSRRRRRRVWIGCFCLWGMLHYCVIVLLSSLTASSSYYDDVDHAWWRLLSVGPASTQLLNLLYPQGRAAVNDVHVKESLPAFEQQQPPQEQEQQEPPLFSLFIEPWHTRVDDLQRHILAQRTALAAEFDQWHTEVHAQTKHLYTLLSVVQHAQHETDHAIHTLRRRRRRHYDPYDEYDSNNNNNNEEEEDVPTLLRHALLDMSMFSNWTVPSLADIQCPNSNSKRNQEKEDSAEDADSHSHSDSRDSFSEEAVSAALRFKLEQLKRAARHSAERMMENPDYEKKAQSWLIRAAMNEDTDSSNTYEDPSVDVEERYTHLVNQIREIAEYTMPPLLPQQPSQQPQLQHHHHENNTTTTLEDIQQAIAERMEMERADQTGRIDYASIVNGATILYGGRMGTSWSASLIHAQQLPLLNRLAHLWRIRHYGYGPDMALTPTVPNHALGQCWSFIQETKEASNNNSTSTSISNSDDHHHHHRRGEYATLTFQLAQPIRVHGFSVEHPPVLVEPPQQQQQQQQTMDRVVVGSALHRFRVVGYESPDATMIADANAAWFLGAFEYTMIIMDGHGGGNRVASENDTNYDSIDSPLHLRMRQEFPAAITDVHKGGTAIPILRSISVLIDSNWGEDYTCLYRFRVFGENKRSVMNEIVSE